MVGQEVELGVEKTEAQPGKPVLSVSGLVVRNDEGRNAVDDVSFSVRKGEILGVAGVEGNGQTELSMAISGLWRYAKGRVEIAGKDISGASIRAIRELGFSHIPEDRMSHGANVFATIYNNLISDRYYKKGYSKFGLLRNTRICSEGDELIADYLVKCKSGREPVSSLSGGNIQKLVVARECSSNPGMLLANQPTRGIDVMAAAFVRKKLIDMRDKGAAILLISADIDEVLEVSDSIIVMHNGKIAAYLPDASVATAELLGEYILGLKTQLPEEIGRVYHEQ